MRAIHLILTGSLLFCACDETDKDSDSIPREAKPQQPAEPSVDKQAARAGKIKELEREIETSTNIISDLEAAVLMERAKVEDDPDYDQSFLQETLSDQEHQRELIERAQKQIEMLKGSVE